MDNDEEFPPLFSFGKMKMREEVSVCKLVVLPLFLLFIQWNEVFRSFVVAGGRMAFWCGCGA